MSVQIYLADVIAFVVWWCLIGLALDLPLVYIMWRRGNFPQGVTFWETMDAKPHMLPLRVIIWPYIVLMVVAGR